MKTRTSVKNASLDVKAAKIHRDWKHRSAIARLPFRSDRDAFVFSSSMDQSIQRWDLEKDEHATFEGHESWLRGIGFSSLTGAKLYSGGYDGRLCFWDRDALA